MRVPHRVRPQETTPASVSLSGAGGVRVARPAQPLPRTVFARRTPRRQPPGQLGGPDRPASAGPRADRGAGGRLRRDSTNSSILPLVDSIAAKAKRRCRGDPADLGSHRARRADRGADSRDAGCPGLHRLSSPASANAWPGPGSTKPVVSWPSALPPRLPVREVLAKRDPLQPGSQPPLAPLVQQQVHCRREREGRTPAPPARGGRGPQALGTWPLRRVAGRPARGADARWLHRSRRSSRCPFAEAVTRLRRRRGAGAPSHDYLFRRCRQSVWVRVRKAQASAAAARRTRPKPNSAAVTVVVSLEAASGSRCSACPARPDALRQT